MFSFLNFFIFSIDRISQIENKVSLSLLECDTGCPDLVPEALSLPLRHGKEKETKRKAVGPLVDKYMRCEIVVQIMKLLSPFDYQFE